jgi:arylsulfatase
MPHVPLAASDRFRGTTARGLFGDVLAELDWSVGEILDAIKRHGLDEQTLVIVTSDNGPWLAYGDHAGSAGPLREGKITAWEGGIRVPFITRWPGKIPPNRSSNEVAMTIDLLPTIARLTGAPLPALRIDGKNIWPLLSGVEGAKSPHEAYFIYFEADGQLQAVLSGRWKLVFPHQYRTLGGQPGGTGGQPVPYLMAETELALYNLSKDVGESKNLADRRPAVVARLQKLAEKARAELGDALTGRTGTGVRKPGRLGK